MASKRSIDRNYKPHSKRFYKALIENPWKDLLSKEKGVLHEFIQYSHKTSGKRIYFAYKEFLSQCANFAKIAKFMKCLPSENSI